MIEKLEYIPVSSTSYPFASAVKRCGFASRGYVENEYYMYGTSNVYQTGSNGAVGIRCADVPYVNRMIVRAPKDSSRFSGNVVVEIINPTSDMEIDRMWIVGYKKLMRDGDIYVGFTSKPNTIRSLKAFNEERYGRLSWTNPTPEEPFPFKVDTSVDLLAKDIDISYETGLVWDMMTDIAKLLREKNANNPLQDYAVKNIVLTGWSQSAGYLRRYVNDFAFKEGKSPYDGYFPAGGVCHVCTPLNQYEYYRESATARISYCPVPLLSAQTESEISIEANFTSRKEDSNDPNFLYRSYEFAGGSHDTMFCYVNYYKDDPDIARIVPLIWGPPIYNGKHAHGNNYPQEYLFCAAYANLFKWIESGVAPCSCEKILTNEKGEGIRDALGNTVGGVRTCMLNYPTAHYSSADSVGVDGEPYMFNASAENMSLFGYAEPFSPAVLKELYGSLDNYRKLVTRDTMVQVTKGFVLKEDAEELIELAVNTAAQRGLH